MYNDITKHKEDFSMAKSHETKIKLNYESENITIINDLENLVNYFIKFIHSLENVEEYVENSFIFSDKADFDCCVKKATAVGLLQA